MGNPPPPTRSSQSNRQTRLGQRQYGFWIKVLETRMRGTPPPKWSGAMRIPGKSGCHWKPARRSSRAMGQGYQSTEFPPALTHTFLFQRLWNLLRPTRHLKSLRYKRVTKPQRLVIRASGISFPIAFGPRSLGSHSSFCKNCFFQCTAGWVEPICSHFESWPYSDGPV